MDKPREKNSNTNPFRRVKLSDLRAHLAALELQPSKSLGQNFLHDQNLATWMIRQLEASEIDQIVEVGPGLGALTELLVERFKHGTAIEKDGRLAGFLQKRFAHKTGWRVLHADACEFDRRTLFPGGPATLIGNLPYYVSTAVILNFLSEPTPVRSALFTLQREVAERLSAVPGTSEYGSLTTAIQRRWRVKYLRTLPASVFHPEPKVESGVVLLSARRSSEIEPVDGAAFERWVRQGFSQRRKQLRKLLDIGPERWTTLSSELGFLQTVRAEELSVSQWVSLVNALEPARHGAGQQPDLEIFDVVNQRDEVVDRATRAEVHARDLLHRAVHIFVFNRAGELFLQKRSHLKDRHPGVWDSAAAGHLDSGETYDTAAAREIVEELGVECSVQFARKLEASADTGFEFIHIYTAIHEGPFRLHPWEIESGAFFPVDLVKSWIAARPKDFAPGFIRCFDALGVGTPG